MKLMLVAIAAIGMTLSPPGPATSDDKEAPVRQSVQSFYAAFDQGFVKPVDFATGDWNHISPSGGWDRGLEAVLKDVQEVHRTFLRNVTDTAEEMSVRFASDDVAVATVISTMSPFVSPDGAKHGKERHVRTFVVVKRGGRWLVMQDQNTTIVPLG
jgi:uncharacterized protein (TIGR02246 family)